MELSIQQEEKQYNESATQKMDDVDMRYTISLLQHIMSLL